MVRVAVSVAEIDGLKVMDAVQFAPPAKEAGQDAVWPKSAALGPVIAKAREPIAPVELLVRVIVCAVDVEPTAVDENVRVDGLTENGRTTFAAIGSV